MKYTNVGIMGGMAVAVVASVGLIWARAFPLGVPGEWEWSRLQVGPAALDLSLAFLGVLGFALFAGVGFRDLSKGRGRLRECVWVAALFAASLIVQVVAQSGGPAGHGLTKWTTLGIGGSSGYFKVAKSEMADPWSFWSRYPEWVRGQDALHIGTHPPGLLLASRGLLGLMRSSPRFAAVIDSCLPASTADGFRVILGPMPRADRAALALMGFLTLLLCSATVIPLYVLARAGSTPSVAWASATLWPLVPSAILFQPTADTAFPFLTASALAFAVGGGAVRAICAGMVLGVGTQFTLAFFPVGLVVGIVQLTRPQTPMRRRVVLILATGAGFLAFSLTLWVSSRANPFAIWWWNQKNHGRFYVENPRSYVRWSLIAPIELAIAAGVPIALLTIRALLRREIPRAAWAALIVIALLNVSGKNLSEVARLWLPFMPALNVAAGSAWIERRFGALELCMTIGLVGLETLGLQSLTQFVYPF